MEGLNVNHNSKLNPSPSQCWDSSTNTLVFCYADNRAQDFVHSRKSLYCLSYIPSTWFLKTVTLWVFGLCVCLCTIQVSVA